MKFVLIMNDAGDLGRADRLCARARVKCRVREGVARVSLAAVSCRPAGMHRSATSSPPFRSASEVEPREGYTAGPARLL